MNEKSEKSFAGSAALCSVTAAVAVTGREGDPCRQTCFHVHSALSDLGAWTSKPVFSPLCLMPFQVFPHVAWQF